MRALLLFLAFVVVTPALAAGDKLSLAVTPLDGLGVDEALLGRLDDALLRELRGLDTYEVIDARGQPACDGEAACLAALATKVGAQRVLAGSVAVAGDQLHIALKIVDAVGTPEPRSVTDSAPLDGAELRLRASALKLVAPDKYNKSGSIIVAAPLTGADVIVDGIVRGQTPLFGPIDGLTPGRRDVEIRFPDAKPWRGFVELRFGEPHRLEIALVDGALREVVASPAPGDVTPPAPAAQPVLLFTGLGVAGAGVALGVGAIVAYDATATAAQRVRIAATRANLDEYQAFYALCGTLTVASALALVAGGGLIAVSVME